MADIASIGLAVNTKQVKAGIQELDKLAKSGDKVQDSFDDAENQLNKTDNATRKLNKDTKALNKSTKDLTSSTNSYSTALGGVLTTATALAAIKQADSYQLLADRVALATKETGDFASVQAELFRISQETGTGLQNNVELFDRIRIGAQELGKSNTEVLQLVEAVDMLAASGGTSQEAVGNATLQLSQALAGGILRAEEFNSIVENTPKIAQAIAEGLDTSIGGLRAMVLEGEVLADDVFSALLSQTDQISEDFEEMPIRLGRATTTMGNSVTAALGQIDSKLGITSALANGINDAATAADELTKAFASGELDNEISLLSDTTTVVASATAAYTAYTLSVGAATTAQRLFNTAVRANPIGLLVTAAGALGGVMFTLTNDTDTATAAIKKLTDETVKLDRTQKEILVNQLIEEQVKLEKELLEVQKLQASERDKVNDAIVNSGLLSEDELLKYNNGLTAIEESGRKVSDTYAASIESLTNRIKSLQKAISDNQQVTTTITTLNAPLAFDYTDQYAQFAKAMQESSKTGPNIWEPIGEEAAQTIASSLASGDFSSFGDALGSAAASAVGSAVAASLGGVGGAIAGGLATGLISSALGGRQQTGSSTTVSFSGGQASGFNQQNFSGLFGSSSSRQELGSGAISALNNSLSISLSAIDNALLAMGSTVVTSVDDFSTTVKVGEGEFTDAIEDITANYISANFAAIEDYARAGETFVETFERINEEMVSVIDSFSLSTGSGSFQSAADAYIETQANIIEATTKSQIDTANEQLTTLEQQLEENRRLQLTGKDSLSKTQRADLRSEYTELTSQIEDQQALISELTSRLGSGLQTATVDFSNAVLESIATIEGISSDDAVGKLNQLTASYEENYFTLTEQTERAIESAKKELEEFAELGIDETTSLDEFQTAFEAFVNSDAFTPEGYSQWLLAADALADLNNVVDDIDSSGTFESITDFVKDLMGLAADGTETLAAATAQYQETLALAQTGDADALAALTTDAQAYLDAVERSASTGTDVIIARSQVASDLSGTVPAFAAGGTHTGGFRLVGENGPEIEATGPSRIFSNSQSKSMLDNTDLTRQVAELKQTMESGMFAVAKNTNKSYKVLNRWDTQGLPEERPV